MGRIQKKLQRVEVVQVPSAGEGWVVVGVDTRFRKAGLHTIQSSKKVVTYYWAISRGASAFLPTTDTTKGENEKNRL